MFVLAILEDKIKITPDQFDRDTNEVLIEQIEQKYANKVVLDVGFCICFYDFIEIGDPYIYPAEGSAHQLARFRMIIFRPFVGEILVGRVSSSSPDGIRVTMDFFDDISIPSYLLQTPSEYKTHTSQWVWKYDSGSDGSDSEFVFSKGETIRFKVRSIKFTKISKTAKGVEATTTSEFHRADSVEPVLQRRRSSSITNEEECKEDQKSPPMQIICAANEDGLGMIEWWS